MGPGQTPRQEDCHWATTSHYTTTADPHGARTNPETGGLSPGNHQSLHHHSRPPWGQGRPRDRTVTGQPPVTTPPQQTPMGPGPTPRQDCHRATTSHYTTTADPHGARADPETGLSPGNHQSLHHHSRPPWGQGRPRDRRTVTGQPPVTTPPQQTSMGLGPTPRQEDCHRATTSHYTTTADPHGARADPETGGLSLGNHQSLHHHSRPPWG